MSKTGLSLLVVCLLTAPRRFFCYSSSLFVRRWYLVIVCSSSLLLPRAVLRDCVIFWVSSLIFFTFQEKTNKIRFERGVKLIFMKY